MTTTAPVAVHLTTLGCARNEVDSEELAARLEADGFLLVAEPEAAQLLMVNTCGFVETAKKDSVDTLLAAADYKADGAQAVVAVGCLAERYGSELAEALPEADAVLGFDDYPDIAERLRAILAGQTPAPHVPRDRRSLLPVAPAARQEALGAVVLPGHQVPDLQPGVAPASGPRPLRLRLDASPCAPLKIASGCDRRCSFCAIPAFRGSFVSRPADQIVGEARWLVEQGVREVFLVSENSTSYGKDLGDLRALEALLRDLSAVDGLEWIRVSYLQPAELRPSLIDAIAGTPKVVPYFDLSFQHAAAGVLRAMRRFGDADSFLALLDRVRAAAPLAGVRSNFIVGFPGESDADLSVLSDFISAARLDAIGVFGYSDEDGTSAEQLPGKLDPDEVATRAASIADLATELVDQRAAQRIGESIRILIEGKEAGGFAGRGAHQGPEVDGTTLLVGDEASWSVGQFVAGFVVDSAGVDLIAEAVK